jgi:hypothetical protein
MIANFQINEIQESNDQGTAQKLCFILKERNKISTFHFTKQSFVITGERIMILMSTISCEVSTQITS